MCTNHTSRFMIHISHITPCWRTYSWNSTHLIQQPPGFHTSAIQDCLVKVAKVPVGSRGTWHSPAWGWFVWMEKLIDLMDKTNKKGIYSDYIIIYIYILYSKYLVWKLFQSISPLVLQNGVLKDLWKLCFPSIPRLQLHWVLPTAVQIVPVLLARVEIEKVEPRSASTSGRSHHGVSLASASPGVNRLS